MPGTPKQRDSGQIANLGAPYREQEQANMVERACGGPAALEAIGWGSYGTFEHSLVTGIILEGGERSRRLVSI